jgi:hypothetical protein
MGMGVDIMWLSYSFQKAERASLGHSMIVVLFETIYFVFRTPNCTTQTPIWSTTTFQ